MPTHISLSDIISLAHDGQIENAITLCEKKLLSALDDAETWHLSGLLQMLSGHPDQAVMRYEKALEISPSASKYHSNLGNAYLACGDPGRAEKHYRLALALPSPPTETTYNFALLLSRQERYTDAVSILEDRPQSHLLDADSYRLLGDCQQQLGQMVDAAISYEQALKKSPNMPDTLAELALVQENLNQLAPSKSNAQRAIALQSQHDLARFVLARVDRREGRLEEALLILESMAAEMPGGKLAAALLQELGSVHDRLDSPDEAMACFIRAKRMQLTLAPASLHTKAADYLAELDTLVALPRYFPSLPPELSQDEPSPVFLIGFPRSGTTLLDTMLGGHPNIQTLEERPLIQSIVASHPILFSQENFENPLPLHIRQSLQALYFDLADREVPRRPGAVWVDKMPLNLTRLPHILRIFPSARFILAVRHPCDVCLSCQMQLFAMNPAMANLHSLESTAKFYARVMQLWLRYTNEQPLSAHIIRYEDLLQTPEAELKRLLEFLSLPWHSALMRFNERAKDGRHIDTPSYQQVSQALYQHANGRWQRYRKYLTPIISALEPAMQHFGYSR